MTALGSRRSAYLHQHRSWETECRLGFVLASFV